MLSWFKRRSAPKVGPDYRHVDSLQKAEELYKRGELAKLLLLPAEFGGEDIPPNVVYVPPFAVELKNRLDQNTILRLVEQGKVRRYTATPQYEGKSVVPSSLTIAAKDPESFEGSIAIWGEAVQKPSKPAPEAESPDITSFTLVPREFKGMGPEEFVRAYIADYERWNTYACEAVEQFGNGGIAAAEFAYAGLLGRYCPLGLSHQPIAFGSRSTHSSLNEAIVNTEPEPDGCLVKTCHTRTVGALTMEDDYEYHLKSADGRWFLTSVLYVDQDGKYEGL